MFNLNDLVEMFEGGEEEQNRRHGKAKRSHHSPFAFSREDDDEYEGDHRYARQRHDRRHRDDDDENPLGGMFG